MTAPLFNSAGMAVVFDVFGEPRNRCAQCPTCGNAVWLGAGSFRGHLFQHDYCGTAFQVYRNAKIRVRS